MIDARRVETGLEIPSENYCDQPYMVVTKAGNWLCMLTTGPGLESKPGQHVVATISTNQGRNWSELIDIEPACERMTSWVTGFMVPNGRIYAVYNFEATSESTQHGGSLCCKYSDDDGRTWSADRYRIPMRMTRKDRENVAEGREQFFWCIDKPVVTQRGVFFGIPKLHSGIPLTGGESWVVHSSNILTVEDPKDIEWVLLPEGDEGVWSSVLGDIQEEQNLEVLSDGTLFQVMRTEIGVVREAVELFYLDNDFYPSSVEDLVKKPTTGREVKKWPENGYLDRVPVDPWRNEYIYIAPATDGPFEIISLGRDGAEGGEGYDRDIRSSDLRGTGQDH